MITDDELERRLHEAGERFRAATTKTSEVDTDRLADVRASTPRPRRRLIAIVSTVAVAAAVAALALVLVHRDSTTHDAGGGGSLTGVTWTITAARDAHGTTYTPNGRAYLIFKPNGAWTGADGCNGLSGEVGVAGAALTFSGLTSTLIGCPAGVPSVLGDLLQNGARWSVHGYTLTLSGAAGTVTATEPYSGSDPATLKASSWRLDTLVHTDADGSVRNRTKAPGGVLISFTGTRVELELSCGTTTSFPSTVGRAYLQTPAKYDSGFAGDASCVSVLNRTFRLTGKVFTEYEIWVIDENTLTITRDRYTLILRRGGARGPSGLPSASFTR